jgi:hypothetical protein
LKEKVDFPLTKNTAVGSWKRGIVLMLENFALNSRWKPRILTTNTNEIAGIEHDYHTSRLCSGRSSTSL